MDTRAALVALAQSPVLNTENTKGFLQRGLVPGQLLTLQIFPLTSPVLDVGAYEARESIVGYLPSPYCVEEDDGIPALMRERRKFASNAELRKHLSELLVAFAQWDRQR